MFFLSNVSDIGEKISVETLKQLEEDKQLSLKRCEDVGWEKANFYKDQCVEEALADANLRSEKKIKKLQKEHEKTLQKEITRVEGKFAS